MDAYVCVGTKMVQLAGSKEARRAAHMWVMTKEADGDVAFWESLTAERCSAGLGPVVSQRLPGSCTVLDKASSLSQPLAAHLIMYHSMETAKQGIELLWT